MFTTNGILTDKILGKDLKWMPNSKMAKGYRNLCYIKIKLHQCFVSSSFLSVPVTSFDGIKVEITFPSNLNHPSHTSVELFMFSDYLSSVTLNDKYEWSELLDETKLPELYNDINEYIKWATTAGFSD